MAFTDGIECPDLLELGTWYINTGVSKAVADGLECPDLLGLSSGEYVAPAIKVFFDGLECPDLLGRGFHYVSSTTKVFTFSRNLFVQIRPFVAGDDSIEILLGLYLDFEGIPRAGRAPLTVRFKNLSSEYFQRWRWDFGDGETSIAFEPVHIYQKPGSYDVSLQGQIYPEWFFEKKRR